MSNILLLISLYNYLICSVAELRINIKPGKYSQNLVSYKLDDKPEIESSRPEYVGAAHELIHGLRDMKGEAVRNRTANYNYYGIKGKVIRGQAGIEELQTVGIYGSYRYSENLIRREHGLKLRRTYFENKPVYE